MSKVATTLLTYLPTYSTEKAISLHHTLVTELDMDADLAWALLETYLPESELYDLDVPSPTPKPPWID